MAYTKHTQGVEQLQRR